MEKAIRILAVVLVVQVALAVGLQFSGSSLSPAAEAGPLLSMSPDQVNAIQIAESDDKEIKLERTDSGWILADDGFPADPDKVNQLLDQVAGLSAGEVVARTEGARERFKVADNSYKRRVTLHTGDDDRVRLFFGTSPGKDRIHARVEGEKPIQVVQFGTYDAPTNLADWQDKGVLQITSDRIAGLDLDGLQLQRKDSKTTADNRDQAGQPASWRAAKLPEGKVLQQPAVQRLTQQLATLRFEEILSEKQSDGYHWDQPVLQLTVQRSEGEPVEYRLAKKSVKDEQTEYALKASSRKEYFSLATPVATQLNKAASRQALLGPTAAEQSSDESSEEKDSGKASSSGS